VGELLDSRRDGRALVVANEQVAGEELRRALVEHLGRGPAKVFVVAPALIGSGFKHTMGDVDEAIGPAEKRLRRTLEELRDAGFEVAGEVGDADPMQAIADEIYKFHPDQVLVVAHREEEGDFAERGLLEQAQRDLDLPVVELVVDRADPPHLLDVERTSPGAGREEDWRPSGNLPPMSRRDLVGIVVAVVGTLLLGAIAAAAYREGSAAGDARMLIALGMALLNVAHVVGMFLFDSVGYRGMWSRFLSRISIVGTPVAIAVCLLLGLLF
jgi:hypothetical protein